MHSSLIKLLFIPVLIIALSGCGGENKTTVILRYDDYSKHSPTSLEKKILNTLKKHDASITFGVIPNLNDTASLGPEKARLLSKAAGEGTVEIAQHGYTHEDLVTEPEDSEFAYVDYDEQLERLRTGKALLEDATDVRVNTFIPPGNRWDLNTLRALEATGFDNLSSRVGAGEVPESTPMNFVSGTFNDLSRLRSTIEKAEGIPFIRRFIVVVVHPYDFKSVDEKHGKISFGRFKRLVEWMRGEKGIQIMSIGEASNRYDVFDAGSFRLNRTVRSFLPLVPPLQFYPVDPLRNLENIYHSSTKSLLVIFASIFLIYSIVSLLIGVISYAATLATFNLNEYLGLAGVLLSLLAFAAVSIYAFQDLRAHWLGVLCSTTTLGVCIGALLARRSFTRTDRRVLQAT